MKKESASKSDAAASVVATAPQVAAAMRAARVKRTDARGLLPLEEPRGFPRSGVVPRCLGGLRTVHGSGRDHLQLAEGIRADEGSPDTTTSMEPDHAFGREQIRVRANLKFVRLGRNMIFT